MSKKIRCAKWWYMFHFFWCIKGLKVVSHTIYKQDQDVFDNIQLEKYISPLRIPLGILAQYFLAARLKRRVTWLEFCLIRRSLTYGEAQIESLMLQHFECVFCICVIRYMCTCICISSFSKPCWPLDSCCPHKLNTNSVCIFVCLYFCLYLYLLPVSQAQASLPVDCFCPHK